MSWVSLHGGEWGQRPVTLEQMDKAMERALELASHELLPSGMLDSICKNWEKQGLPWPEAAVTPPELPPGLLSFRRRKTQILLSLLK